MKKTSITTLVLFLTVTGLIALYSNEFLNGAYTEWLLGHTQTDINTALVQLGDALHTAQYNNVVISSTPTTYNTPLSDIQSALSILNVDCLDVSLMDFHWDNNPTGTIGMYLPSSANYYRFEAEFKEPNDSLVGDPSAVNNPNYTEDKFFYYFDHNYTNTLGNTYQVGRLDRQLQGSNIFYSNNYAWVCNEDSLDQAGMALDNLRWKWNKSGQTLPDPIGPEFKFPGRLSDNYLYVTYRLLWNQSGYDPDAVIADASLMLYSTGFPPLQVEMTLIPLSSSYSHELKISDLTDGTYKDGMYLFTYRTELNIQQMKDANLLSNDDINTVIQIEPRLYWNGISRLTIDCVEIEDTVHRSLTGCPDAPMIMNKINDRIENLITSPNLKYLYSKDEPTPMQFDAYNILQAAMNNNLYALPLITCTNYVGKNKVKLNGSIYDNPMHHLKECNLEQLMIDRYPVESGTIWNTEGNYYSIQNALDRDVLGYYKQCRQETRQRNKKFYTVTQTFGEYWLTQGVEHWGALLPPREMLKCLKLLPLCYGVDGIFDYAVIQQAGSPSSEEHRRYTPLDYSGNTWDGTFSIIDTSEEFEQLCQANSKVMCYGPLLKGMNWVNAETLMANESLPHTGIDLGLFNIDNLFVTYSAGVYKGYVQCGYYLEGVNPALMLVNRRAIYKDEEGSTAPPLTPSNYSTSFTPALPQTVQVELAPSAYTSYDNYPALFDPYENQLYKPTNSKMLIPIGPGDGRMLQMVPTLPANISSSKTVSNKRCLSGDVTIMNGVSLTFTNDSELILCKDSNITVNEGSTLTIRGKCTIAENSHIIVNPGGILNINAHDTSKIYSFLDASYISITSATTNITNTHFSFNGSAQIINNSGDLNISNSTFTFGTGNISCNSSEYIGALHISNSTFNKNTATNRWGGILVRDLNDVTIENSTISNALCGLNSENTNINLYNTKFEIPIFQYNGQFSLTYGVKIVNTVNDKITRIICDDSTK